MANVNEGRVSKKKILEVAKKGVREHGLCDEIKSLIAELGVEWVDGVYTFTVKVSEDKFSEYDLSTPDDIKDALRDVLGESTWAAGGYEHVVTNDDISYVHEDATK